MATLSFSFDTGSVTLARITDAMAITYGYQATIDGSPNPQTKVQFARSQIKRIIIEAVHNAERQTALATAESTVTDITLT